MMTNPPDIRPGRRIASLGVVFAMTFGTALGLSGVALAGPPSSTPHASPDSLPDTSPEISTESSTEPHANKQELPTDTDRYQTSFISIVSARLSNTTGSVACAADEAVKKACEGKSHCSINVTDQLCREERPGLLIETLYVNYRCATPEKPRSAHAYKPLTLHISCNRYLKPVS